MSVKSDFCPQVYNVTQLNSIIGCFIKSGVIGIDDLKVMYKDGNAVISKGKYILPDGSVLTVDKEGHTISDITDGYIYIKDHNICFSKDMDSHDLLAGITDGKCVDLRQRAYIYLGERSEQNEL